MNKIKNTNDKITAGLNKFTAWISGKQQKSTRRKVFNSLWAVFIGLLIAAIFISFLGVNPFSVYVGLLTTSIFSGFHLTSYTFITILSILMIVGIAMAIGFKSGLFNIGVSGQMMISGTIGVVVILTFQENGTIMNTGVFFLAIFLGMMAACLAGAFVGVLKAFLNVHEVVSTILLNWVFVYVAKFIFSSQLSSFAKNDSTGSIVIAESDSFIYSSLWWVWLLLGLTIVLIAWVILSKTTIGYRIKVNGLSKEASKYSGTNEKLLTISTMSISAALAGLAGSIYYISYLQTFPNSSSPVLLGFHSIAISLLAYNSPIGLIFSSILYAILETGNVQLLGISNQTKEIISGIIIYLAALSALFADFRFLILIKNYFFLLTNKSYWTLRKAYRTVKKGKIQEKNHLISEAKKELEPFKEEIKEIWKKLKLLDNGISFNLDISKMKTTEDMLKYFNDISTNKAILKKRLDELNYYEIFKIKNNSRVLLKNNKDEYKKNKAKIYDEKTLILLASISNKWAKMRKKEGVN